MAKTNILFVQGGGEGAHDADAQLSASLQQDLGSDYKVHFPRMPDEGSPDAAVWGRAISAELGRLKTAKLLVAHSIGASILLRHLIETQNKEEIEDVYLLAAPAWDGERWSFDELKLPADADERLASVGSLTFYHCRDDETVPFAHLALHAERMPNARTTAFDRGGHQFESNMSVVAADIKRRRAA